jgi:hypothetical protein
METKFGAAPCQDMRVKHSPREVLRLTTRFAAVLMLFFTAACSSTRISHPCPGGTPAQRIAGETAVRQREGADRALFFVQSVIGSPAATIDVFWPERAAGDDVFAGYDIFVLALREQQPEECIASPAAASPIARFLDSRLASYPTAVLIAHDGRDAIAIVEALSSIASPLRERVKEVFLFNTPAADALLRSLPQSCTLQVRRKSDLTICSTFDRNRLAGVPVASQVCDQVVIAAMPPEIAAAPLCDDAVYPIFRTGLAGTIYEREHVLPRFGEHP